jgi:hypothetical protein
VILGDREGHGPRAVAECQQGALGAGQTLFEHERPEQRGAADRGCGLGGIGRHDDPLAGGQPVELDDDGTTEVAPPLDGAVGVEFVEALVDRARHAERGREMTREALRGLDP